MATYIRKTYRQDYDSSSNDYLTCDILPCYTLLFLYASFYILEKKQSRKTPLTPVKLIKGLIHDCAHSR